MELDIPVCMGCVCDTCAHDSPALVEHLSSEACVAACGCRRSGSLHKCLWRRCPATAIDQRRWSLLPRPGLTALGFRLQRSQGYLVNYQSVGSGQGVRSFLAGSVDFGTTDGQLRDADFKAGVAGSGELCRFRCLAARSARPTTIPAAPISS